MVKKLTVISIALIVLNLVLLVFIFSSRNGPPSFDRESRPPREDFDSRLGRRLDFSDSQLREFQARTRSHRRRHRDLSMALLDVRGKMHRAISNEDTAAVELLLDQMDSLSSQREREAVRYAQSIIAICDDSQKKQFMRLLESSVEGRRNVHRGRGRGH